MTLSLYGVSSPISSVINSANNTRSKSLKHDFGQAWIKDKFGRPDTADVRSLISYILELNKFDYCPSIPNLVCGLSKQSLHP